MGKGKAGGVTDNSVLKRGNREETVIVGKKGGLRGVTADGIRFADPLPRLKRNR